MRNVVGITMRGMFLMGTFHYIKTKGQRANPKDAPVLIGAPHTSFYDAVIVICSGPSAVVAKAESGELAFFGSTEKYFDLLFLILFYLLYQIWKESCKMMDEGWEKVVIWV